MRAMIRNQKGGVLIMLTLFLMFLLCFVAFGTEAGRWYLLRAEVSKAVDAAALAGAKNISNPYVDPKTLATEFCAENFPTGAFGTPGSGQQGAATFNVEMVDANQISVDGHATSPAIIAQLLGIHEVPVSSGGAAAMRPVEIMMVLDRSGSMGGQPMADLKTASKSFLDYFADTQDRDKMGLISFAATVTVNRPLANNFVGPMKASITTLNANGLTNAEDAIDHADGPGGFTNQSGVPESQRIKQFMVFFSDGRPNAFRDVFKYRGQLYDAVVHVQNGNCDPGDASYPDLYLYSTVTEGARLPGSPTSTPTGDGLFPGSRCGSAQPTTRWYVYDAWPVPGYAPDACRISNAALEPWMCATAADLAVDHAKRLKDEGVTVFTIGLGQNIHTDFLTDLASSPDQVYMAPTSSDLQAIFQKVAQDIKLRLVQ